MKQHKLTAWLLVLALFAGSLAKAQSPVGDVVGKVTVGYQGWFAAPGDGSPFGGWWHYTEVGGAPSATNTGIKSWPDTREYTTTFPTAYNNAPNGRPGNLFSSYTDQTINTHFLWMQQNGIDCAALQRFNPTGGEGPIRDAVTAKVKTAAEAHNVKFYIMYDVTGWMNMQTEMKADWTSKMSAYTSSPAYAKQNGKPVVCIWGMGLNDTYHPFSSAACVDVINWFKAQGCYVIGGVRGEWRTVNDGYTDTYNAFNMITPWLIGKIGTLERADSYYYETIVGDQAYCNAHGIDYQATILPGDLQERQRVHGDFMWKQFYNTKRLGAQGIYISMFDEYNEGNQIAKTAENPSQIPVGSSYLGLDEDGIAVSADYYLRLTNDGGKMFKGQIPLTATRPTPYFVNAAPGITNLASTSAQAGTYLTYNIVASGGPTGFNATGLPAGLTVNTTTGVISGIPATAGNYTVTLSATNAYGTGTFPLNFSITAAPPQAAYGGTSWALPGKIEAENFDTGGQGVAYNDATATNSSGQYRTNEGVDIEGTADTGGGFGIGFTGAGEWLEYTVNVATAGTFTFQARLATAGTGNTFHVEVDGYNISGSVAVPNSGGWQVWETVSFTTPTISAGPHVIRFYEETGGYNINYFNFISVAAAPVISSPATATGTTGAAFNYAITASNAPVSFGATGLPAGLSVNASTGLITGAPSIAGTYTATISATNAGGTASKTLILTINSNVVAPVISSAANAAGTVGASFSYAITATNTPTSFGATALPAGLSINASTGLISGTPTTAGTYTVTVSATNAGGTATKQVTITINPASVPQSPYGGVAASIPGKIEAENYDLGGQGVAYNDNDAINSGGQYRTTEGVDVEGAGDTGAGYDIGFTNAGEWMEYTVNVITAATYTLEVRVASPGTGNALHVELDGVNISGSLIVPNTGGWQVYQTVSVTTPSLSSGQHILRVYEETGGFNLNYINFVAIASAPVVSSAATASALAGTAFNYTITASNAPAAFAATGLPAGLTVNASTGVISGTVATAGTYNVIVSATNAAGTGTKAVTITITVPAPVISSAATASGTTGAAFTYTITASNAPATFSASGLPVGLTVNASTGVISGTPTTAGTYTTTVGATNATGTGTRQVSITISNPAGTTPYGGSAWAIPGKIEAENYDDGGEGIAYHDAEALNQGGQQRTNQGVDVETSSDGTLNVGWTGAGEWLKYTVNVTTAGVYSLQVRVASPNTGKVLHVEIDGSTIATIAVPNTTGWQTWQTVSVNTTSITAGLHSLRIYMDTDGFNLNHITFAPVSDPAGVVTCYKAPTAITVNGSLSEPGWNLNKTITKTSIGAPNNTATFGVLWDNTNLYIGAKVIDASLRTNAVDYWNADAIEIFIDANNNKLSSFDGYDNQFTKTYGQSGVYSRVTISGLQHAYAMISGGYTIEFAIPWSQLGITAPAAGTSIGFDISNDDDDSGTGRSSQAVWNGTGNNYLTTVAFGTLVLNAANSSVRLDATNENNDVTDLNVYPNPAIENGILTIQTTWEGQASIEIANLQGLVVKEYKVQLSGSEMNVSTEHLPSGIYLLRVRNSGNLATRKFVIQ